MPAHERPANGRGERDSFIERVLRALDDQLGPSGDLALRAELEADADKRRLFVDLCLHTQALLELIGSQRACALPGLLELEALGTGSAEGRPAAWPAGTDGREGSRRTWLPWAVAAAACLFALLATGLAWIRSSGGPRPSASAVAGPPRDGRAAGGRVRHEGSPLDELAVVLKLDGVRWEPSDRPPLAAGDILGAGRLALVSGRATLALLTGVTLTLEGPADVDLVSVDRVFCRRGKLRASVPKGAEGFVIASPASAVVDRGTEFAVNVDADGRSRVIVFEGVAEAALLDGEGSPKLTRIVERSQSFDLDPRTGRIDEAEARPDGFVPAPVLDTPSLELGPSYAAAVLDSRPISYWRFESSGDGSVPNEIPGRPPLRRNGAIEVSGAPGRNGCAVFKPGDPQQFLSTDGLWELPRAPGHAVELWFLPGAIRDATLLGFYPPKDYLAPGKHDRFIHTFLLELTAHERGSLFKPAAIRFLHRWPLDTRIGNNLVSERLYIPGRWHHVVAQKDGDRMELFLDGELERVMPLQPDHPARSCRLVVGRRTPDPLDPRDARPFVGLIDELAIYDRPLGVEEVRRHHRLAATEETTDGPRAER
jgi:hypothetical protein